jgi:hypothetical protein
MSAVPEKEARLSPSEIEIALKKFMPSDWSRAESIAAAACAGLVGWTYEDLLQEAITKLLEGARTCPVGVHPLVMLKTVMRGIASNIRKQHAEGPIDDSVALAQFDGTDETDTRPSVSGEAISNPQQVASAREALAVIEDLIKDDEELALLAVAWAEGLRGDDAAEALDWDKKKYEAARKRLTRRLCTLASEWSTK